jgi:hypothetical protein
MVFNNNLLLGAAGQSGVFDTTLIERSAWFDGVADYLEYTPASGSGNSDWTFSAWVRRLAFGSYGGIFSARVNVNNIIQFYFSDADKIRITVITAGTTQADATTVMVFRDTSWYHLALQYDGTNSLLTLWVNGESVLTDAITSTAAAAGQSASAHDLGVIRNGAGSLIYFGKLAMAQATLILGSAPAASTFLDTYTFGANGSQYVPKADATIAALATTAGGNSFCLTTAIGDGTDASANGNNFTPTSMSDAANGTADTPSNIWCVWNRLQTSSSVTLLNGNLDGSISGGQLYSAAGTVVVASGKWYYEAVATYIFNSFPLFGVVDVSQITAGTNISFYTSTGSGNWQGTITHGTNSTVYLSDNTYTSDGVSYNGSTDVIMVAFDADAGKVWFGKNGVWNNSTDPATDTGGHTFSVVSGNGYRPYMYLNADTANTWTSNFGQNPFAYTPPENFLPLNTANLPTPDYQGIDYFNPILYTGNGSTNDITGVGFQPDLVWIKNTSSATSNSLYDVVRGVQKQLESDNTSAETTEATGLTAFGSDGFTVGSLAQVNGNTNKLMGWSWLAGGAGASNTDGSITSTVSKAAADHFSIVTYTGTGAAATVGHGLGGVPDLIMVKNRGTTGNWATQSSETSYSTNVFYLDLANNFATAGVNVWNNTDPTSSVFSVRLAADTNASTNTYVAYCFKNVPGVCQIGSYKGNGSSNGPYVPLGFTPSWLMVKSIQGPYGTEWFMYDLTRRNSLQTYAGGNANYDLLYANLSSAGSRYASTAGVDFIADGFKIRGTSTDINYSGTTFLYIAIADIAGGGDLPPIYGR